jgi:hypothetical protein
MEYDGMVLQKCNNQERHAKAFRKSSIDVS